jgi:hypothetical protein
MKSTPPPFYILRRTKSGNWDIVEKHSGLVVEGGFFSRRAAEDALRATAILVAEARAEKEKS